MFLEKCSANNFALSDEEDNKYGPLNRRGIADLLFLRTLLAIRHKSREPSFWEVMDSFVFIGICMIIQGLLACLNFTLQSEGLSFWYKRKKYFYELWQQHKLLKTMEISEA